MVATRPAVEVVEREPGERVTPVVEVVRDAEQVDDGAADQDDEHGDRRRSDAAPEAQDRRSGHQTHEPDAGAAREEARGRSAPGSCLSDPTERGLGPGGEEAAPGEGDAHRGATEWPASVPATPPVMGRPPSVGPVSWP